MCRYPQRSHSARESGPNIGCGWAPSVVFTATTCWIRRSSSVTSAGKLPGFVPARCGSISALVTVAAQVPVQPSVDHTRLLASSDPRLATNKRLVYDFWRKVIEAGHLELANQYLAEDYIQHNPNVPTGRAGFVGFFSKFSKAT